VREGEQPQAFRGLSEAFGPGLRITIAIVVVAATVTGVVSLMWPKTYKAEAIVLPDLHRGPGSSLFELAAGSGIGDLFGGALGSIENPILTYPEILRSRTILERVLLSPYPPSAATSARTVIDAIGVHGETPRARLETGVFTLRELTEIRVNPRSGLITVGAITPDSVLSAYIVQRMLEELDHFNVDSRASQGQATREFVQARLAEAKGDLAGAERALAGFREANLRIGNSPQLLLEQSRLEREVDTRAELYRLLARQFELARVEEKRDTPTFSIIDPARPPVRKHGPRVAFNVLVAAALAAGLRVAFSELRVQRRGSHSLVPTRSAA
jgi:uncharacterized protein involved in exopolysaccharide biosynthesis